ncbi:MAG TPA: class I SAM-dependent methyltransferase [Chromatiales bacterium]|nr:class I SAM-dependent methyltransferase [Chromatiales bacterium]
MSAQYDAIAQQYRQTKSSPLRTFVEVPSLFAHAGDLAGCRVLDLACGDGFYSRQLRERGAAEVVGVDVSAAMIELARAGEQRTPLGIEYHCADAAELPDLGRFDLVFATYLLHYAADVETLNRMCANIAAVLQPEGRLLALNENPDQPFESGGCYAAYGFSKTLRPPLRDGAVIDYRMMAGRGMFAFEVHYFSRETYQRAFEAAGFGRVCWHALTVTDEGIDTLGPDYFEAWLRHPPVQIVECSLQP